jgi:hypothetical protein
MKCRRGLPIGAYTSQPLANYSVSDIDHRMKEEFRCKCYLRYCDDVVGLARTKHEAWQMLDEYVRLNDEAGLVVKGNVIVAPIGEFVNGSKRKHRKRQRSHKRKKH